jgi:hypothetical protein
MNYPNVITSLQVTVIQSSTDTGGWEAPTFTIFTKNPDTGLGWREDMNGSSLRGIFQTMCGGAASLEGCVNRSERPWQESSYCHSRKTYDESEAFVDLLKGFTSRRWY